MHTSTRSRFRRFLPATAVVICMAWPALTALGEPPIQPDEKVWDQAVVTKLAGELEQTFRQAYAQSLKAPPQETAIQQRERDATQGVIRRVRDVSEEYARKMAAGYDRGSSEPYFRAVVEEFEYMWDSAGEAVPAEAAQPTIARLNQLIGQIRALYDGP
jgi:hypothetical protein